MMLLLTATIIFGVLQLAESDGPKVFITICSLADPPLLISNGKVRQIQLNWYNASPQQDDWIALYNTDPTTTTTTNTSEPLVKYPINNHQQGNITTDYQLDYPTFNISNLQRSCINYWVAYINSNTVLNSNCLRIEPTWMNDNRDVIGDRNFKQIMIPGTHDAGSFRQYMGLLDFNPYVNYIYTQDENFMSQLIYGIRHFDIRIAYNEIDLSTSLNSTINSNTFFLNHNIFPANPFLPELQSIKEFVLSTKEFIFMDFHAFETGFTNLLNQTITATHQKLLSLLQSTLGDLIVPKSVGNDVTFNQLWNTSMRIFIFYNDPFQNTSDLLWPGVYQAWADTTSIDTLKSYFGNIFDSGEYKTFGVWSAQAELTPGTVNYVTQPFQGLRVEADEVNLNVTYWFKDLWWNLANIVATDYFHGNNIIEVSIQANRRGYGTTSK